jgi:hypothetical protein
MSIVYSSTFDYQQQHGVASNAELAWFSSSVQSCCTVYNLPQPNNLLVTCAVHQSFTVYFQLKELLLICAVGI